jgi:hypothetical protein
LTTVDRFVLVLIILLIKPHWISRLSALVITGTLLEFYKALVNRKYRLLFSSAGSFVIFQGERPPWTSDNVGSSSCGITVIGAMDFLVVPTACFTLFYVWFVIGHSRREILITNVTPYPTAAWVVQQFEIFSIFRFI